MNKLTSKPDPIITGTWLSLKQLALYTSLRNDPVVGEMEKLLDLLMSESPQSGELVSRYAAFTHQLYSLEVPAGFTGNAWQYHLISLLIADDNPFTRHAEQIAWPQMSSDTKTAAAFDFLNLQKAAAIRAVDLNEKIFSHLQDHGLASHEAATFGQWPGWEPLNKAETLDPAKLSLMNQLLSGNRWEDLLPQIADYYYINGAGKFGAYKAFRWSLDASGGYLEGIPDPDPITFDSLIGYARERKIIIDNTAKFVQGLPANNVLLYGERGTGKSSSVKALLHMFGSQRLRMVEVPKHSLAAFPRIIHQLKDCSQKFIIFVDDLSFEENETDYKYLKAVLEGGLETRPANILIYATSNRRHLIKENFSDRNFVNSSDEVRIRDTMQEKLSLADRFGITVTFSSPAQPEYLEIVEGLTRRAGLDIPQEELKKMAIQWEMRYNGRSGRTARQFVDWLIGEKKMK